MYDELVAPYASVSGSGEGNIGSTGVASVDADDPLDDDTEGARTFGAWWGRLNDGLDERDCMASRELERRMSSTSEEPRGVLGGGWGFPTDPARARPDIKLNRRSRFFVLLAGDDDTSGPSACLIRGRDATESSDQRDARAVAVPSAPAPAGASN